MIVVLARAGDRAARALVTRWKPHGAALLSPADLSRPGWCYSPMGARREACVVDGREVETERISAVLIRLALVTDADVPHIHPEDRAYVAAEMTAFLVAWLSSLDCPVLNPPVPPFLTTPPSGRGRWVHLASELGIPVEPSRQRFRRGEASTVCDEPANVSVVTVVGQRCVPDDDEVLSGYARQLAAAARSPLLTVRFSLSGEGPRFLTVDGQPDVSDPVLADSLFHCLSPPALAAPGAAAP